MNLEELIQYWKTELNSYSEHYGVIQLDAIKKTIEFLEKLKEVQNGNRTIRF